MANKTGKGGWKPGQSGNPKGRPPKNRALTELLKKAGSRTLEDSDGKRRAGKRIVPRMLWELATMGQTTLPDGRELVIDDVGDMMTIWKFLYQHIDGPPRAEFDIEHSGDLFINLNWGDEDSNDNPSETQ